MSNILSFLGWTFLPDLITNNAQSLYYSLTISAGAPKPQPGTSIFLTHRRRIYALVILAYLLYTLYEADWTVRRTGSFYTLLGVGPQASTKEIQSRFRKLTLLYHPDKATADSDKAALSAQFAILDEARKVLTDDAKRLAYDRFGPVITTQPWTRCKTAGDFVYSGLSALLPFYAASAVGLWMSTWLGFLDVEGTYWRYLALTMLACVEAHAVTRPWATWITRVPMVFNPWIRAVATVPGLSAWSNSIREPYLPFQALTVAHRALVAFLIALSRLGPVMKSAANETGTGEEALKKQISRLEQMVGVNITESTRMLALETVPFRSAGSLGSAEAGQEEAPAKQDPGMEALRGKIRDWFVTNTVRQDPEVRQAVERLVERRARAANGDEEAFRRSVPATVRGADLRQRQQAR